VWFVISTFIYFSFENWLLLKHILNWFMHSCRWPKLFKHEHRLIQLLFVQMFSWNPSLGFDRTKDRAGLQPRKCSPIQRVATHPQSEATKKGRTQAVLWKASDPGKMSRRDQSLLHMLQGAKSIAKSSSLAVMKEMSVNPQWVVPLNFTKILITWNHEMSRAWFHVKITWFHVIFIPWSREIPKIRPFHVKSRDHEITWRGTTQWGCLRKDFSASPFML